jgi:exopolysaccharide biosynthesis polyprenyl glycosylphosphotransferase
VYQIAQAVRPGPARDVDRPAGAPPAPVRLVRPATRAGEGGTLLAVDATVVAAASLAAKSPPVVASALAVAVVLALAVAGLYRARLQFSVLDDLPRLAVAVGAVVAGGGWWAWSTGRTAHDLAAVTALWGAVLLCAVVAGRVAAYRILRRHRRRTPGRATIVVGSGDLAVRLAEALRADPTYGLAPVGFVGPPTLTRPAVPVLAPVGELERAVARCKPLHLIVAFPATPDADLVSTLRRCRRYGATVHIVPRLFELPAYHGGTELVRGIPLARLRGEPAQLRRWAVKRLVDVGGAGLGLVLLAPLFAACALAVLCESGLARIGGLPDARRHGVLFRQERVTRDGKPFTILKFRSLTPSSELESQLRWNINHDARLGPVGRLLRFSSLDELPQLVNVLRGDMSLVGPRPERPFFVEEFRRTYAGYPDRHRVPAGITGWAQIHGLRGDTSIEERVEFDNHYIEHWSLGLDLKIILRTVGAMLSIPRI